MDTTKIKKILQSKIFLYVVCGIGVAAAVAMVFQAGVWVGYRKAAFSFRWGDNYYRAFGGPRGQFAPGLPHGDFPDAHGADGRIVRISLPTLVIEGRDGIEKVVVIQNDTDIRRFRDQVAASDLKIDDQVVVIGSPDDQARIDARLIRILPPFPGQPEDNSNEPRI